MDVVQDVWFILTQLIWLRLCRYVKKSIKEVQIVEFELNKSNEL